MTPTGPSPDVAATARVAVTHEVEAGDALVRGLEQRGFSVLRWPSVRTVPPADTALLTAALSDLSAFDWVVFTSRRAVDAVATIAPEGQDSVRVAAVGARVAESLGERGWRVDLQGSGGGTALAEALVAELTRGARILFPAGNLASPAVETVLGEAGAKVHRVEAYCTAPTTLGAGDFGPAFGDGSLMAITFLSPSAVRSTVASLESAGFMPGALQVPAFCMGNTTGESARQAGFVEVFESPETSKEAVARLVCEVRRPGLSAESQPSR